MTQAARGTEAKIERISIRATARQRTILLQAAEMTGKTVTAFLLDAAYLEAQRTLADRRLFTLDETRWQQFAEALDRPVTENSRLRALLQTPGVLD